MEAEKANLLVQRLREQRLSTLSLADQIKDDLWREPRLAPDLNLHDLLAHVLGWDEWAVAVFEISLIRDLPAVLQHAIDDVDAFNARSQARHRRVSRDDMLGALQSASPRLIASAKASGNEWYNREIDGLLFPPNSPSPHIPSVGEILRVLRWHEFEHGKEIMETFDIAPRLDYES
jgi:hypothetical protein